MASVSLSLILLMIIMMAAVKGSSSSSSCYKTIPEAERKKCNDKYPENKGTTSAAESMTNEQCQATLNGVLCDLDNACKYCDQEYVQRSKTAGKNLLLRECKEVLQVDLEAITGRCPSHLLLYIILFTVLLAAIFVAIIVYIFCFKTAEDEGDSQKQKGKLKGKGTKAGGGYSVAKSSQVEPGGGKSISGTGPPQSQLQQQSSTKH